MANGISNTNPRRGSLAILEIGSLTGESAQAWTEYFGPNTYVDMITYGGKGDHLKFNNPTVECKRGNTGEDEEGNDAGQCGHIHTFYCDQSDAEKLEKEVIAERPEGWDIVIDDGSHVPAHNIISFEVLWKNVRPGGIYVVEDIETSYYPKVMTMRLASSPPSPLNALSRFRQYADVINRGYIGPHGRMYSLFEGDDSIMEIGYARNVIFIRKSLDGKDAGGKEYGEYPIGTVQLSGYSDMTTEEALAIFKEQSKGLDKWRPESGDSTVG